jgi:hypothetical protein
MKTLKDIFNKKESVNTLENNLAIEFAEVNKQIKTLEQNLNHIENIDLMDACQYELIALKCKQKFLLKQAKEGKKNECIQDYSSNSESQSV